MGVLALSVHVAELADIYGDGGQVKEGPNATDDLVVCKTDTEEDLR